MIRLTFLMRRKPEMTREAFQTYWRTSHGPLAASLSEALGVRRYVQVHTIDDPLTPKLAAARGDNMEPPYDGVAELWWDDWSRVEAALSSTAGRKAGAVLVEDEQHFIDLPESPAYFAYEYPQINPVPENLVARPRNDLVKIYFPLRHLPSLTLEAAQLYWHTYHGPLIRSQAAAAGILRYLQVHRTTHPLEAALRKGRGTTCEPYTGHAELWVTRGALEARFPEARDAAKRAITDEGQFIDFTRSAIWLAKEHVFIDKTESN